MTKEEFLQLPTTSNEQFVTERILTDYTPDQINMMIDVFNNLDRSLYKSWAKDLPFAAIKEALLYAGELVNAEIIDTNDLQLSNEETALNILRSAVPANDIVKIKAAYDLIAGEWTVIDTEKDELLKVAKQLINNQINKELKKSIMDRDYPAFVEAWKLLEYESGDDQTDDLLNEALNIFITNTKIEVRALPGEQVIKESTFDDRIAAAQDYVNMTAGHAFNAFDFVTKYPGQEAKYLYVLMVTDIHGIQYTTEQLGSLTGPA